MFTSDAMNGIHHKPSLKWASHENAPVAVLGDRSRRGRRPERFQIR